MATNGISDQISQEVWGKIAINMGFKTFDKSLADDLFHLYHVLIEPMEDFIKLVSSEVLRCEKMHEKECKPASRKRRMMAGSRFKSTKKTMKASSTLLINDNSFVEALTFENMNVAKVTNGICGSCGINVKLDNTKGIIVCTMCNLHFHEKCTLPMPNENVSIEKLVKEKRLNFQCRGCVAFSLHKDPLLNFGFKDAEVKFDLSSFGGMSLEDILSTYKRLIFGINLFMINLLDIADGFKREYFEVENPSDVDERIVEHEFWRYVHKNTPVNKFQRAKD